VEKIQGRSMRLRIARAAQAERPSLRRLLTATQYLITACRSKLRALDFEKYPSETVEGCHFQNLKVFGDFPCVFNLNAASSMAML